MTGWEGQRLLQSVVLHLAQCIAWQVLDEDEFARNLETGELRQQECTQFFRRDLHFGAQHHERHRHFLPPGISDTDHRRFGHGRMLEQDAFDFRRIDVLAARHDHVLLAVMDREVAISIADRDVAGMEPAIAYGFGWSPLRYANTQGARSARARRLRLAC